MTMSDRIAVMNDGSLEQVGTPTELYYSPVNRFVAEFIGSPSINFLDAELVSLDDDAASFAIDGTSFEFVPDDIERRPAGNGVVVGFRPESIRLGQDVTKTDYRPRVNLIEQVGNQVIVTLDDPVGEGELRAISGVGNDLVEDETTAMEVDRNQLFLFDATTGRQVTKSRQLIQEVKLEA